MSNAAEARERRGKLAAMACCALLAILPLLRDLGAPYGRGMGGWQGSFFSIAAQRYELDGALAHGGYPRMEIAGGRISQDDMKAAADGAWVYANHPPAVPLLAWWSIRSFAPDGWERATPPSGTEAPLRLPFLLLHGLGAAALWLFLHAACGAAGAWSGALLYALLPIERVLGMHPNYEHAVLVPLFLALRSALLHARRRDSRPPWACAAWLALASCITWSALCFVPPLALVWLPDRGARRTLRDLCVVGLAAALPLALHLALVSRLALDGADAGARSAALLSPWRDGLALEWAQAAWNGARIHLGSTLWCAIAAAPIFHLRRGDAGARAVAAMLVAALACMAAFARHVLEGQEIFQLLLAPAIAATAGTALAAGWRAGRDWRAATVACFVALALLAWQEGEELRARLRAAGRYDDAAAVLELPPLPQRFGAAIGAATRQDETVGVPSRHLCELATAWHAWRDIVPMEAEAAQQWLAGSPARAFALPALDTRACARARAALGEPAHAGAEVLVWRKAP